VESNSVAEKDKRSKQDHVQTSSLKQLKRKRDEELRDAGNKRLRPVLEATSNKKQPVNRFTPTIPKPFTFQTDLRGQHYQDQFVEKLEMWRKRDQGTHEIHAKPAPQYPPPMAIKRSVKPLTAAHDLVLHSQIRALERKTAEDEKKLNAKLAAIEQDGRMRRSQKV
jgi:hypothetical protein